MMINEKLPPTFLGAATPRSMNSQRAPPNRSTGLVAFFSSRRLWHNQGPPPAHYQVTLRLHTLKLVIRQGWAWEHVVEALLGLENCPSRLGRSHLRTAENSGLTSTYASA